MKRETNYFRNLICISYTLLRKAIIIFKNTHQMSRTEVNKSNRNGNVSDEVFA